MLWKCCTQYASKFGKLGSGQWTGKMSLFIPTPRKGKAKESSNYHTIALISHASKVCSKFSKSGFNSTWTMNFHMCKLDLENAEEPEVKLPTSVGSLKSKRVPGKHLLLTYWLCHWHFWTVVWEKTLESPLDCKDIQPVHPKGDKSWVFTGRTDVEAEIPILWPPDWRADSFEKTLMLGKIEGRRRRGWQKRWLDGITNSMHMSLGGLRELVMDRVLVCCSLWVHKELDTTKWLNWTENL